MHTTCSYRGAPLFQSDTEAKSRLKVPQLLSLIASQDDQPRKLIIFQFHNFCYNIALHYFTCFHVVVCHSLSSCYCWTCDLDFWHTYSNKRVTGESRPCWPCFTLLKGQGSYSIILQIEEMSWPLWRVRADPLSFYVTWPFFQSHPGSESLHNSFAESLYFLTRAGGLSVNVKLHFS